MKSPHALVELLLACAAAVASVVCWQAASYPAVVAPVLAGEPETISQVYSAPMLVVALTLAAAAGVLAVVGVARWRRSAVATPPAESEGAVTESDSAQP